MAYQSYVSLTTAFDNSVIAREKLSVFLREGSKWERSYLGQSIAWLADALTKQQH